ncbi:hypothetical protein FQA39_LY08712 [Lamprigera yunnana]|nr:hypothetical protein FQA39_LY08712 [Lamprigera yunnana]
MTDIDKSSNISVHSEVNNHLKKTHTSTAKTKGTHSNSDSNLQQINLSTVNLTDENALIYKTLKSWAVAKSLLLVFVIKHRISQASRKPTCKPRWLCGKFHRHFLKAHIEERGVSSNQENTISKYLKLNTTKSTNIQSDISNILRDCQNRQKFYQENCSSLNECPNDRMKILHSIQMKNFVPLDESPGIQVELNALDYPNVKKQPIEVSMLSVTDDMTNKIDQCFNNESAKLKRFIVTKRKEPTTDTKESKKEKLKKFRKVKESESDSNSDKEIEYDDSTDTDVENFSCDDAVQSPFTIELEKYYAVQYEEQWYIGRVINRSEENFYVMKFLKQEMDVFVWPKNINTDISKVYEPYYGPIDLIGCEPFRSARTDLLTINKKYKVIKKML